MKLKKEILMKVKYFLEKHRLSFSEKDLSCIAYKVQIDIQEYHMIFRDAVLQEVEDFYGIQLKKKKQNEKCFQFGDYILQGIQNAFNDKTSFWLSKRYMTVAMYCFTADDEQELKYQLKSIDSYINRFYTTYEIPQRRSKLQEFEPNEWAKLFRGKMIPTYLLQEIS